MRKKLEIDFHYFGESPKESGYFRISVESVDGPTVPIHIETLDRDAAGSLAAILPGLATRFYRRYCSGIRADQIRWLSVARSEADALRPQLAPIPLEWDGERFYLKACRPAAGSGSALSA